jgi:hypothetical protein
MATKAVTDGLRWLTPPIDYVFFTCTECSFHNLSWYCTDNVAHRVRLWFINYMKSLGDVVVEAPGTEIVYHKSVQEALEAAVKCTTCRAKVMNQFSDFVSNRLQAKITEVIEKVRSSSKFHDHC